MAYACLYRHHKHVVGINKHWTQAQWKRMNMNRESLFMIWGPAGSSAEISPQAPSALFLHSWPKARRKTTPKLFLLLWCFVSALVETDNKLNNSILWLRTVMGACGRGAHVFNYAHVQTPLMSWATAAGFKFCTMALKFKDLFPRTPHPHPHPHPTPHPPLVFTHPFPLSVRAAWLLFWKWSTEILAEQGEQTACMPCGFLTPYFSALGFWRATRRLHSWQLIEQMQVSIWTIWTCNEILVCVENLWFGVSQGHVLFSVSELWEPWGKRWKKKKRITWYY